MAKLAAQLKDKFCGLVGRITGCGRAGHKDAAKISSSVNYERLIVDHLHLKEKIVGYLQQPEIRSRGVPPSVSAGSKPHTN
ncbi:hypothetical protein ABZP36_028298 [Zizania latifolia]